MGSHSRLPGVKHGLDESNRKRIEQCESQQKTLRHIAQNKQRFSGEERSALQIQSQRAFEEFWDSTLDNKTGFDKRHEQGIGRATKNAANIAASAHDIVQNFSPLVDMIKDFGAPYGSMALGTICFVLVVAKNRTETENQITSTLLEIQDRLVGFQMYQHIHVVDTELEHQLHSKIVDAYESFILFCVAASRFYSQRGIARWLNALGGTGYLDAEAAQVKKALVDVRRVCEELVHRNIHDIKNQNRELMKGIKELQEGRYADKLDRVRTILQVEPYSSEAQLAQLARRRSDVIAEYRNPYVDLASTYKHVEGSQEFRNWLYLSYSQVLVLSGYNDARDATHCWLSPVALDFIAKMTSPEATRDTENVCIFYILGLRDEDNTFTRVTRFLIYRLLLENKQGLRKQEEVQELDRELDEYTSLIAKPYVPMHELQEVLAKILVRSLGLFDSGTNIWIILERADQCRAPRAEARLGARDTQRKALLKTMVHAAQNSKVILKILVVVSARDWNVEKHADELGQHKASSLVLRTFEEDDL